MSPSAVKVRVNASGRRLVGYLHLPAGTRRTSDLLNGPETFLPVYPEGNADRPTWDGVQIVSKGAISYVEALEEPSDRQQEVPAGGFISVVMELREPETQLLGEVFLPEGGSPLDVLNDRRHFVNVRNVHFNNFLERYAFLAVGKKQIVLLKL